MKDMFDNPQTILSNYADHDAVDSFIAWRKKIKKPLTDRAARMIGKTLQQINAEGGDATEALDMAQEWGWTAIKAPWYWKKKEQENGNGNSSNWGPGNSGHSTAGNGGGMAGSKIIQENADFGARWAARRSQGF